MTITTSFTTMSTFASIKSLSVKRVAQADAKKAQADAKKAAKQAQADAKQAEKKAQADAKKAAKQAQADAKQSQSVKHDNYSQEVLQKRYKMYLDKYMETAKLIETGLPIRHENPPEDITENITKFIINKHDNDPSCKWAKSMGLKGDLYSDKYKDAPPEVKAFTSNGPSQFGPKKKFGVLYFLDMREWLQDIIVLWRVNLTNDSPEWKKIKMNKTQTHEDQCDEGRRPHISWDKIYPQIAEHCVKVYEGTFENIFTN